MGVKDLSAVINRYSPRSTSFYANLSSFAGKTLALDANLMVSKFHYSRNPFAPTRWSIANAEEDSDLISRQHLLSSFYSLLNALTRLGIKPVVVFDGNTRLAAKAVENKRRREGRELEQSRASAEVERNGRLEALSTAWTSLEASRNKLAILERYRSVVAERTEESIPLKDVKLDDVQSEIIVQTMLKLNVEAVKDEGNLVYSSNQQVLSAAVSAIFSTLAAVPIAAVESIAPAVTTIPIPVAQQEIAGAEIISKILEQRALDVPTMVVQREEVSIESIKQVLDQSVRLIDTHVLRASVIPYGTLSDIYVRIDPM